MRHSPSAFFVFCSERVLMDILFTSNNNQNRHMLGVDVRRLKFYCSWCCCCFLRVSFVLWFFCTPSTLEISMVGTAYTCAPLMPTVCSMSFVTLWFKGNVFFSLCRTTTVCFWKQNNLLLWSWWYHLPVILRWIRFVDYFFPVYMCVVLWLLLYWNSFDMFYYLSALFYLGILSVISVHI